MIGGVGYRWQGDGSFGLLAVDRLAAGALPGTVTVVDLGYGAIYAAQDVADARPDRLLLVAAVERGDPPGTIRAYRYRGELPSGDEILERVREAGAGVIHLDHLLVIGQQMQALPPAVDVVEVEPLDIGPGTGLTPLLQRRLDEVLQRIQREVLATVEQV